MSDIVSRTVADILGEAVAKLDGDDATRTRDFLTALRDLPTFIFQFARTLDEHDTDEITSLDDGVPGKPFPDWPYLHDMVDLYLRERLLLVEKARQLLITWLASAIVVYEVRAKPSQRWGWVSLKAGHADEALERMWVIIERLPGAPVKTQQGAKAFRDIGGALWVRSENRIQIPTMRGNIHAMSQSVDEARSFTFSGIVADEVAFQPKFKDAYTSLKPTIDKGRFLAITTPGPFGFTHDLYSGKSFEELA